MNDPLRQFPDRGDGKTHSEDVTWHRILSEYHPWAADSHKAERLFRELLRRIEALEAE